VTCKLCGWLCAWLCSDTDAALATLHQRSRAWESAHSNEYELWSKVGDQQRELLNTAKAVRPTDPDAAFLIYRDVADDGVVWAMEVVGYHYQYGWGTSGSPDFELAQTYYQRAIDAGSSMAMLRYAWLLANHGQFDISERLLQESAEAGFIPAYYWLARCRFRQSSDRQTCREIKSLLVRAADAGHPAAAEMLARLRMRGNFGFREIPRGFREMWQIAGEIGAAYSAPDVNGTTAALA
jgi:TPR repeat protein